MLDGLDGGLIDHTKGKVQRGLKLRVTFYNFDFRSWLTQFDNYCQVTTNSHKHLITQFITFDRVSSNSLNKTILIIQDIGKVYNGNYLLLKGEMQDQRRLYYTI